MQFLVHWGALLRACPRNVRSYSVMSSEPNTVLTVGWAKLQCPSMLCSPVVRPTPTGLWAGLQCADLVTHLGGVAWFIYNIVRVLSIRSELAQLTGTWKFPHKNCSQRCYSSAEIGSCSVAESRIHDAGGFCLFFCFLLSFLTLLPSQPRPDGSKTRTPSLITQICGHTGEAGMTIGPASRWWNTVSIGYRQVLLLNDVSVINQWRWLEGQMFQCLCFCCLFVLLLSWN